MNLIDYFTDEDRQPKYRGNPNRYAGHCYVASEVIFHVTDHLYKPQFIRHEGEPHWYNLDDNGWVFDATHLQFETRVPYENGRGKGFLTKKPSKRAQRVIARLLQAKKVTHLCECYDSEGNLRA